MKKQVALIIGSVSDKEIAKKTCSVLDDFKIGYEILVASAHRTPKFLHDKLAQYERAGIKIYIAIAGMAAHLGGVIASLTTKPVIAVPVSGTLKGIDALLSSVQMPPGIPLAVVAIDGGKNAGLLAAQILAVTDKTLAKKLADLRKKESENIMRQNKDIGKISHKEAI